MIQGSKSLKQNLISTFGVPPEVPMDKTKRAWRKNLHRNSWVPVGFEALRVVSDECPLFGLYATSWLSLRRHGI